MHEAEEDVVIGLDQLAKSGDLLITAIAEYQLAALPGFDD